MAWRSLRRSIGLRLLIVVGFLALLFGSTSQAQELVQAPRADGTETALRVYRPAKDRSAPSCPSLALISPGAGGTENGYLYLGEGLRDRGWLAIVIGHKESGPGVLFGDIWKSGIHDGLTDMVTDPVLYRDRLMDVGAALAWAQKQCDHPFKALIGHSMGSETVMFEAGAANKLGVHGEDRFDAYVAISPSGPGSIFPEHAWNKILKPLYVLTGTNDKGLEGSWEWRARPFDDLPPGCKWLGVIDGATHLNFAGVGFARSTKKLTIDSIEAFLNGARRGSCAVPASEAGLQLQGK